MSESLFDKKRLQHRSFTGNFANLLETHSFIEPSGGYLWIKSFHFFKFKSAFSQIPAHQLIPLGLRSKPNNKITSLTSSLSFVLELSKAYSKENLWKKKCPCKCLLECEGKILVFIKILHCF